MRSAILALFALTLAAAASSAQSVDPRQAPTGRYQLEQNHSLVLFAISHLDLTDYYGRFDKLSGTLNFDAAEPEKSAVSITIETASINTPSTKLTGELASAVVFDAGQFPAATFKSTSIQRTGPTTGKITGDLTIKNVTKPVTLDVVFGGGRQNPMGNSYALGFHATAAIKRSDFGLTSMPWDSFVGDEVKLTIEAMFLHQKE
ncbi:MAG TPA: YceI family protein [Rhizomicrobium sp.]